MASERIRRQIDRLLDEAEQAVVLRDWSAVRQHAQDALVLDPENGDALALLAAAERGLAGANPTAAASAPSAVPIVPAHPEPVEGPSSFVSGRYTVKRFLGEGGKKKVYLAHDALLDRDVAFALIKTEGLDEQARARITREAQAMGRLGDHPNIMPIYDFGQDGDQPYLVLPLMAGGDVEGLIEKAADHRLPLAQTLEIAKAVCRGLEFAHTKGIVHRDLKPGNVWLTADGATKIGDFGLAVAVDRSRLTQAGMMIGTALYMPPEQALGGEATPQSDLYSVGCMLYELVTGKPPFQADDPTAVISQHINTPPVAPSWNSDRCPPDLERLILQLLAKSPDDRPRSATEVREALSRVDPDAKSVSHSDSQVNPLDRLAHGVFVGRERELERLRAAFDDAFAGRGSVVMLVGEPGIGKTRTVQELETYARMRGAKVFWGRAHEASGAPAYWPWIQIGRAYRDQTSEETRRREWEPYAVELQRIFPGLRELFPNLPEPPPADSEEAQFALFDAWSSFIRAVAAEQPLVVVLDDVHWADRPTLRMLTHLSRDIDRARLLVLGTYRDTDLDRTHPLSEALAEMNREQLFSRVLLRGLSEPETAAYIRGAANVQPSAELVRRVHVETEGNPFFLSEVVNLMAEEGTLASQSISDVRIPQGVREALGRRLDRLSPEANELLSLAAVIGREFSHELLRILGALDDDALLQLVEEALKARVIEETSVPGEYRFTHALMQDALYAELSTARRVRMHGRVAETLEATYGDNLSGRRAELARHFGEAAVMNRALAEKAVRYAELAAQQAEAVAAWDEAARWYEQALAGLEGTQSDPVHEGDLYLALCTALRMSIGRRLEAWAAYDRAIAAYERSNDPQALAVALGPNPLGKGPTWDNEIIPYRDVLERVLAALGPSPSMEACRVLSLLAAADLSERGDEYARRAREMAETLQLPLNRWPTRLLTREVTRLMDMGQYEQAVEQALDAYEMLKDVAEPPFMTAPLPLTLAGIALHEVGSLEAAEDIFERLLGIAEARRITLSQHFNRFRIARIRLGRNDRAPLETLLAKSGSAFRLELAAAADALVRGDLRLAAELLPTRDHPDRELNDFTLYGLETRVAMARGATSAARDAFQAWQSATVPERRTGRSELVSAIGTMGSDALLAFGDPELLHKCYRLLVEHPRFRIGFYGECEAADVTRGALALHLGDVDAAERHYTEGLEWARRPDVRFGLVEGRCLQGLAAIAETRGDQALAMEHLDAAGEKFAEYGAKLYLDQVLAKKQFLKA